MRLAKLETTLLASACGRPEREVLSPRDLPSPAPQVHFLALTPKCDPGWFLHLDQFFHLGRMAVGLDPAEVNAGGDPIAISVSPLPDRAKLPCRGMPV